MLLGDPSVQDSSEDAAGRVRERGSKRVVGSARGDAADREVQEGGDGEGEGSRSGGLGAASSRGTPGEIGEGGAGEVGNALGLLVAGRMRCPAPRREAHRGGVEKRGAGDEAPRPAAPRRPTQGGRHGGPEAVDSGVQPWREREAAEAVKAGEEDEREREGARRRRAAADVGRLEGEGEAREDQAERGALSGAGARWGCGGGGGGGFSGRSAGSRGCLTGGGSVAVSGVGGLSGCIETRVPPAACSRVTFLRTPETGGRLAMDGTGQSTWLHLPMWRRLSQGSGQKIHHVPCSRQWTHMPWSDVGGGGSVGSWCDGAEAGSGGGSR